MLCVLISTTRRETKYKEYKTQFTQFVTGIALRMAWKLKVTLVHNKKDVSKLSKQKLKYMDTHFTQHKLHHLKFHTKFRQYNLHTFRNSIIVYSSEPYFERLQYRYQLASSCIRHTAFIDRRKLKKTRLAWSPMTKFVPNFFNINHSFLILQTPS